MSFVKYRLVTRPSITCRALRRRRRRASILAEGGNEWRRYASTRRGHLSGARDFDRGSNEVDIAYAGLAAWRDYYIDDISTRPRFHFGVFDDADIYLGRQEIRR